MIEAVIFDMDGLMFDTEVLSLEGWERAFAAQGLVVEREVILKCFGRNPIGLKHYLTEALGDAFDFDGAMAIRRAYVLEWMAAHGVPVKPGLRVLLAALKAAGITCAIASSSSRESIEHHVQGAGLADAFDCIVSGYEIPKGKPEPDIYLAAAQTVGVAPESCMAFEDSPLGIEAAFRAGMKAVMVPDLIAPDSRTREMAFAVLTSLEEGIALIDGECI